MSKITDYGFLFEKMFGTSKSTNMVNSIKVSSLTSGSMKSQLRAAGIDTNSKQYKAVLNEMTKHAGSAGMFTNIQAIKNSMSHYDKDGDFIDQTTGLAGLVVTESNAENRKKIVSIPENNRDEMFNLMKKEFLRENGVANGDTTKRSDVYTNLYQKTKKADRLTAGWTLQQYSSAVSDGKHTQNNSVQSASNRDTVVISEEACKEAMTVKRENFEVPVLQGQADPKVYDNAYIKAYLTELTELIKQVEKLYL